MINELVKNVGRYFAVGDDEDQRLKHYVWPAVTAKRDIYPTLHTRSDRGNRVLPFPRMARADNPGAARTGGDTAALDCGCIVPVRTGYRQKYPKICHHCISYRYDLLFIEIILT
jgi:hypothetical protein